MLSEAQDKLHWSKYPNARGDIGWGGVVMANAWSGKIDAEFLEANALVRSFWHKATVSFASALARQAVRSITAEDLRKGSYWLALGSPKSHKQFNNDDLDRVLNVFRLLVDPEDLAALLVWNDYQQGGKPGERKRHVWWIKQAPLAYVNSILRAEESFYGGTDFERFTLQQLRCLTRTLKNRHAKFHQSVRGPIEYAEGPW